MLLRIFKNADRCVPDPPKNYAFLEDPKREKTFLESLSNVGHTRVHILDSFVSYYLKMCLLYSFGHHLDSMSALDFSLHKRLPLQS